MAGWASGSQPKSTHHKGSALRRAGNTHPSSHDTALPHVLLVLARIPSLLYRHKQMMLHHPLLCFPGTLLWHAPNNEHLPLWQSFEFILHPGSGGDGREIVLRIN